MRCSKEKRNEAPGIALQREPLHSTDVGVGRDSAHVHGALNPVTRRREHAGRDATQVFPKFRDRRAAEERSLPRYVEDEFEAYLKCGRLEHGFLRVKCESCQSEKLVRSAASAAAFVRAAALGGWPRR